MSFVELEDLEVSYDKKHSILKQLNLSIEKGMLVSLLGPSGCGKTTTLRVIAGLIEPQKGYLKVSGKDMTHTPIHQRQFGLVFQSYALFPHLTVYENIAFGLKQQKKDKLFIEQAVAQIIETCDLKGFEKRYPKALSGGQRQRVALARALVIKPELLLLDEPLSNLDAKLRITMRSEIRRIQKELGITTIFITHDQEECFSISDRVAIMNQGVIEQYDTPEVIYAKPQTEFVAQFVGFQNFLTLTKENNDYCLGTLQYDLNEDEHQLRITIRNEDVVWSNQETDQSIEGRVKVRTYLGKSYQYEVSTCYGDLYIIGSLEQPSEINDIVYLVLPQEKIVILREN